MKISAVIDRLEEHKAVLLVGADEIRCVWPRACLPPGIAEGDYLEFTIKPDEQATRAARQATEDLLRQLLADNEPESHEQ